MTPQNILDVARDILLDADPDYRMSDAEGLRYVNAGIKEVAGLLPQQFTSVGDLTCVAGAEQSISPLSALALTDVLAIHGGAALTRFDRGAMDAFSPTWRAATQAAAQQWCPVTGDPFRFFVYPPAAPGQVLDVQYVRVPLEVAAIGDTISELSDAFLPALVDYVVFRAESKDDEHVLSQRAASHYQSFLAKIKPGA